jgi:hypothetical protein
MHVAYEIHQISFHWNLFKKSRTRMTATGWREMGKSNIGQATSKTSAILESQSKHLTDDHRTAPYKQVVTNSTENQAAPDKETKTKASLLVKCIAVIIIGSMIIYAGYDLGYSYGVSYGNQSGYQQGYSHGVADGAGRGYDIRDPTYQEALRFITLDQTDKNQFVNYTYTCDNFASDFKNNAFKADLRSGYVRIDFPDSAHAIIAFNTTDRGVIFVEPQSDRIITLTIGQPYWNRTAYLPPTYNDTVVRFIIVW